jgi:hypothetical protein
MNKVELRQRQHQLRVRTLCGTPSDNSNCFLNRKRTFRRMLSFLSSKHLSLNEFLLSCLIAACYRPSLLCCVIVIRCVCSTCSRDSRTIHTVYSRLELLTFAHFSVCSLFSRRWEQAAGKQSSSLLVDFCALFINFLRPVGTVLWNGIDVAWSLIKN